MSLCDVLRGGRQCDNDGAEIIMSRQACLEAADEIERLRHGILLAITAYKIGGSIKSELSALEALIGDWR
jgi:hypothetical protein